MRSCMYCGRELEKGEVCQCPQSAAARAARQRTTQANTAAQNEQKTETNTAYKTGYSKKDSRIKRAWERSKTKWNSRQKSEIAQKGYFKRLFMTIFGFFKAPVDSVTDPGYISKAVALSIAGINGIVSGLCLYFVQSGARRGVFSLASSLLGFKGMEGYNVLLKILLSMASGLISGILLFMLYTAIFYLIGKFIFRISTARYWDMAGRLSITVIPMIVICALGIVFSMISPLTLGMLFATGLLITAILTYEGMRSEWISVSTTKTIYATALGIFVFSAIVSSLMMI